MFIVVQIFLSMFLAVASAFAQAGPPSSLRVVVAGDAMAPLRLKELARLHGEPDKNYFGTLLEPLRETVASADLAFVNLETPVSRTEPVAPRPFVFNAPREYLRALKWIGFDVLSVANNHSFDQGALGLSETVDAVRAEGLIAVGAGHDRSSALEGSVHEVNGLRVGFLAFTDFLNGGNALALGSRSPYIAHLRRRDEAFAAIEAMRPRVDFLLFSVHWGVEYAAQPTSGQAALARELHQRGVDVVVGHHPHVLQPARWVRGENGRWKITLYSLGNLISNQSRQWMPGRQGAHDPRTRDGALIELHLSRREGVRGVRVIPTWTDNWDGPESGIRTVRIVDEVRALDAEIARLPLSPTKSFLRTRREMLMDRFRRVYRSLELRPPGAG